MSSIEIEYKFKLEQSLTDFNQTLQEQGYTNLTRVYEKTVMFDNKEQLMQITDGRIRLRQSGDKCTLSYKKPLPKIEGEPKKEIEYETVVGDFATMEKILNTMGFYESSSYEKYRTKVGIENTHLTIDEYPFATFVEIEGDEIAIKEVATKLGFDLKKHINKSCDTLFNEWRIQRGLPVSLHMRFDNYDK